MQYLLYDIMNENIPLWNHSKSFRKYPVRIPVPYYKQWNIRIFDQEKTPDGTDIKPLWWIPIKSGGPR